jgi:hypothetical protein
MSIFKLKNKTGQDVQLEWANYYTFPNNIAVDLCGPEIGLNPNDITGITGGSCFEPLAALIRSGSWRLNDGDQDLRKVVSLYLLKYGFIDPCVANNYGWSMTPFYSPNLADKEQWPSKSPLDSTFTVLPASGREIEVLATTTTINPDINMVDGARCFFRVYAGAYKMYERLYYSILDFQRGATVLTVVPRSGNPQTTGAPETVVARTIYPKDSPLVLKHSFGMCLKLGVEPIPQELLPQGKTEITLQQIADSISGHMSVMFETRSREEF